MKTSHQFFQTSFYSAHYRFHLDTCYRNNLCCSLWFVGYFDCLYNPHTANLKAEKKHLDMKYFHNVAEGQFKVMISTNNTFPCWCRNLFHLEACCIHSSTSRTVWDAFRQSLISLPKVIFHYTFLPPCCCIPKATT